MKVVDTRELHIPSQTFPTGQITVRIILTEGKVNDYAAYIGHGTRGFVKDLGNKISQQEAEFFFPQISGQKYRN